MPSPHIQLDPNERIELVVVRHRIGLIPMIIAAATCVAAFFAAVYSIGRWGDAITQMVSMRIITLVLLAITLLLTLFIYIAVIVFLRNKLIITNEKIVQIAYFSLFSRQISQLNMVNVHDVTVLQHGFLPTFFNYGTIKIETAGEAMHFSFPMAKNPHQAAQRITELHETVSMQQQPVPTQITG